MISLDDTNKGIYKQKGGWDGQVKVFHGVKNGLESVYKNDIH